MCGRFAVKTPKDEIKNYFGIDVVTSEIIESYNIAPTNDVYAIIQTNEYLKLGQLQWGLIPRWSKNNSYQSKLINARSETILTKPSFKESFQTRRCLIIADGYYEWKQNSKEKHPYYIYHKSNRVFTFAGLWDIWLDSENQKISTCTIITGATNKKLSHIHERMPIVIELENHRKWLDKNTTEKTLVDLINSASEEAFHFYRVSQFVNSVKNNSLLCMKQANISSLFE